MGKLTGKVVKEILDDLGPHAAAGSFKRKSMDEIRGAQRARLEEAVTSSLDDKSKAEAFKKLKETEKAWKAFDEAPAIEKEKFTTEVKKALEIPESGKLSGFSGNQPQPTSSEIIKTEQYQPTKQQVYNTAIPNTAAVDANASNLVSNAIDTAKLGAKVGVGALGVGAGVGLANAGGGFVNDYLTENQSIKGMQSKAQSTPAATPLMQAKLDAANKPAAPTPLSAAEQAEADKRKKEEEAKAAKGKFDPNSIVGAMNGLAQTMSGVPADVKKQFDPALNKINESLAEFNSMYQADQKEAKDASEKAKNRAEWASIASMLAKNVVGYAAALNGVDPNAMAYQTTDWNKRIQDLNSELDMNLGHLRENMKMKVEAKLGEKKDVLGQMDDTFKAKMDALRAKMEGTKAEFNANLQVSEAEKDRSAREELAKTKVEGGTTVKTEDVAPKVQQALGKAADKKTMNAGVAELKGIAVQLGKDPNQIDALVKKYQGTFDLGDPNEVAPQAQSEIAQYLSGMLTKTTTTGKTAQGAGQARTPVVQSEGMVMVTDIASGKSKQYPANHPAVAKAKGNPNFKVE